MEPLLRKVNNNQTPEIREVVQSGIPADSTMEDFKEYISSSESLGIGSGEEKQRSIAIYFSMQLQKAVDKAREQLEGRKPPLHTEFAILALESWGRECPLADKTPIRLLMITESENGSFAEFCSKIVAECANAGIPCHDIQFGSKKELFRSYVLGDHIKSNTYPPSEVEEIHGCLLRLCTIRESTCVYGNKILALAFKEIFQAIMQGTDENQFQRDRQYIKSFFHHFQAKGMEQKDSDSKKSYRTLPHPSLNYMEDNIESLGIIFRAEQDTKPTMEEIRLVYLDFLQIITFLSLCDKVKATNPWEQIREMREIGIISKKLASQLLCCWNVVHSILLHRIHLSGDQEMNSIENEIFFFVQGKLIGIMARKCCSFLTWLDTCSNRMNPFHEDFYEAIIGEYYAHQAKKSKRCLSTADLWDEAYLHNPTKQMLPQCDWPDAQQYRSEVEMELALASFPSLETGWAEEQQKIFIKHLKCLKDNSMNPTGFSFSYYGEYGGIQVKGKLIESCTKKLSQEDNEAFSISIPGEPEEVWYSCTVLSPECVVGASFSSLRLRISGFDISSHLVAVSTPKRKYIMFRRETSFPEYNNNIAAIDEKEALSVPLQIRYSLQFLQTLILLPEAQENDILWPFQSKGEEMDHPLAFCSQKGVEPSPYGSTSSALFMHPQYKVACHPTAIRMILSLSPYEIINKWLLLLCQLPNTFCIQTSFVLALYHRFTTLQSILHSQNESNSSISHVEVIKKMPEIVLREMEGGSTTVTFLSSPIEHAVFFEIDMSWEASLVRMDLYDVHYDPLQTNGGDMDEIIELEHRLKIETTQRMLQISHELYKRENNEKKETELFELFNEFARTNKGEMGDIASLALQCFDSKHDGNVKQWLHDSESFFQISFNLLPDVSQRFIKNVLKKSAATLRVIDLSNTSISDLSCLKSLCVGRKGKKSHFPHVQTLVLNRVKMKSFNSNYEFSSLISLSLERCISLTKAVLHVDRMPNLQSVSFNDSTSFTSLLLPGNQENRKYPIQIHMLRTSVSAGISMTLGLQAEVPIYENNELQNREPIPNSNIPPIYLQLDIKAARKNKGNNSFDAFGKKVAGMAEVGSACVEFGSARVTAFSKSRRTKESSPISPGPLADIIWNAIAIRLPGLMVTGTAFWRTLSFALQRILLNEEQKDCALHLMISYMANSMEEGADRMSAQEEKNFLFHPSLWENPQRLQNLSKSESKIFHVFCASQAFPWMEQSKIGRALYSPNAPLTSLQLKNSGLTCKEAIMIAKALQTPNASITSLNLKGNEIEVKGAVAIAEALQIENGSLTSLHLKYNRIGDKGVAAIAKALQSPNACLTFLNLANTDLEDEGAAAIAKTLESPDTPLTSLNLQNNRITDVGAAAIANALQSSNASLCHLDLQWNSIGKEGGMAIGKALQTPNTSLLSLTLNGNKVGNETVTEIGQAIKSNCSLSVLHLEQCAIGDEGTTAIALALQSSNYLTCLNLKGNLVSCEGAVVIAQTLQSPNSSLTSLNLRNNVIGDKGALAIAKALQSPNASLSKLNLLQCAIGDEGAAAILETFNSPKTTLTSLYLK